MVISTSNLVGIIDAGVDECGILSRSVGQTNRQQKYGEHSAYSLRCKNQRKRSNLATKYEHPMPICSWLMSYNVFVWLPLRMYTRPLRMRRITWPASRGSKTITWLRKFLVRDLMTLTFELLIFNIYHTWRVMWSTLPPILKTLRLFVHELRVITFPIDYHWECVRGHCACAESRDPWVGGQNNYIFGIPDPDLPIHYTTSFGLRRRLRVVYSRASKPLIAKISCSWPDNLDLWTFDL